MMSTCKSVIAPKPEVITMKDNDLNNDLANVVQLKPQSLKVKLRIGEEDLVFIMQHYVILSGH